MKPSKAQEKKRSADNQPSAPGSRRQRAGPSDSRNGANEGVRAPLGGQAGVAAPIAGDQAPSLRESDHVPGRMRSAVSVKLCVNNQTQVQRLPDRPAPIIMDAQLDAACRLVIQNQQRMEDGDIRRLASRPAPQPVPGSQFLGTATIPATQLTRREDLPAGGGLLQAASTARMPSRGRSGGPLPLTEQPPYLAQRPQVPSTAVNAQPLTQPITLGGAAGSRASPGPDRNPTRNPPPRAGNGQGAEAGAGAGAGAARTPQRSSRPRGGRRSRRSMRQGSSSEASDATGPGPGPLAEDSLFLRNADRHLMVSIDTGFFLQPRDPQLQGAAVDVFMDGLVALYNATHAAPPLSWSDGEKANDRNWHIRRVPIKESGAFPRLFRMISPLFKVTPQSQWRENVTAFWTYLLGSCIISGTEIPVCDTHISVSARPEFALGESKLIAQAALYFETAIDALLPSRNGNIRAKSNWVHATRFAPSQLSRLQSMEFVQPNPYLFVFGALMGSNYPLDDNFAWNFQDFGDGCENIQFRKPGLSRDPEYGLSWAEFTMAFLVAAMQDSQRNMRLIPPTVAGLKWFLARHNTAGLTRSPLMRRVWGNAPAGAMLTPKICLQEGVLEEEIPEEMEVRQDMIKEDKTWRESQVQSLRPRPPFY